MNGNDKNNNSAINNTDSTYSTFKTGSLDKFGSINNTDSTYSTFDTDDNNLPGGVV